MTLRLLFAFILLACTSRASKTYQSAPGHVLRDITELFFHPLRSNTPFAKQRSPQYMCIGESCKETAYARDPIRCHTDGLKMDPETRTLSESGWTCETTSTYGYYKLKSPSIFCERYIAENSEEHVITESCVLVENTTAHDEARRVMREASKKFETEHPIATQLIGLCLVSMFLGPIVCMFYFDVQF